MIKELKTADYVTLLNLVCGVISIYFAFNNNLFLASIFILLGAFFDFLDGKIARLLKQESELGAQLDSFGDIVTFGIAPAALITNLYNTNWITILTLLIPICGALRLARFNITRKTTPGYFIGVPITVNGVLFPILFFLKLEYIIVVPFIIIMSYLMVSTIKVKKVF